MNSASIGGKPESPSEDDRDSLLTVPQAAELLKLSAGTLYHLISEKRIPVIRISARCVRFSRRALLLWLEALTQPVEKLDSGGLGVRPPTIKDSASGSQRKQR